MKNGQVVGGHRKFLVIGHCRSGTQYMATLFQAYDFDVKWEYHVGADGIVAWSMAVEGLHEFWAPLQRENFTFDYIIHLVRCPIKCIASVALTDGISFKKRKEYMPYIGDDMKSFEGAARSWLGWNQICEAQKPAIRIRVEDAPEQLKGWLKETGLWRKESKTLPRKSMNSRKRPGLKIGETITEQQVIDSFDVSTRDAVFLMAERYGYDMKQ
jgi:hypothetical protein